MMYAGHPWRRASAGGRGAASLLLVLTCGGCASVPAYLSMDGDQLWEEGSAAFEAEEWDDAIQLLERLLVQFPGYLESPQARILVARAYSGRGEFATAVSEYERFLQVYRSHSLAPEASLGICEAYASLAPHPQRDQEYTARAEEACGQTWLEFRGLNVAETADSIRIVMRNRLAEAGFQEAEFYQRFDMHNSAIMIFEDVVNTYPETEWAPRGLLGIYRSYVELGWEPEAEEASERLIANFPDSDSVRELRSEAGASGATAGDDR